MVISQTSAPTSLVVGEVQDLQTVCVGDVCRLGISVVVDLSGALRESLNYCTADSNVFPKCESESVRRTPGCTSHHSLVGCDLFGVSVEEGDLHRLTVCRNLPPGAVGEDDQAVAARQNLFYLR